MATVPSWAAAWTTPLGGPPGVDALALPLLAFGAARWAAGSGAGLVAGRLAAPLPHETSTASARARPRGRHGRIGAPRLYSMSVAGAGRRGRHGGANCS